MLNVESLLDATLFTCIGQMGVAGAAIVVQDSADNKLSHFHSKGLTVPRSITIHFSRVGRLARHLQRTGRPQVMDELESLVPENSEDYAKLRAIEAELVVPLISKGNLLVYPSSCPKSSPASLTRKMIWNSFRSWSINSRSQS